MKTYKSELRKIGKLVPYVGNARTHSELQIKQLCASIREFGFTNPVLVDESDGIIAGHGRVLAAQTLGLGEVPVIVLSGLTRDQKRAYIIADNKLALNAGWNNDLLRQELSAIKESGFDLDVVGFATDEMEDIIGRQSARREDGEDEVPAAATDKAPISSNGTVWIAGPHRVICGDCGQPATMKALMDGHKADMVWTDPPYNVNYKAVTGSIQNDNLSDAEFERFLTTAFRVAGEHLKAGGAVYVAHSDKAVTAFWSACVAAGIFLAGCLIWRKNHFRLGRSDYHLQHEPILYGWKEGGAHRFYGGRRKTSILEFPGDAFVQIGATEWQITVGETTLVVSGSDVNVEELCGSVFFEDKPHRSTLHPTMKPVALVERMVVNSTRRGDIVVDMFGGSGTTLIACEKSARYARLSELCPHFTDVIVRRWQDFSGGVATRLQDGRSFNELQDAAQALAA